MSHESGKTRDERGKIAVDIMTKQIKEHTEREGKQMTESQARKQATEIAERANRRRNEK